MESYELPQSFKQFSFIPLLYSDSDLLPGTEPAVTASSPYCGFFLLKCLVMGGEKEGYEDGDRVGKESVKIQ